MKPQYIRGASKYLKRIKLISITNNTEANQNYVVSQNPIIRSPPLSGHNIVAFTVEEPTYLYILGTLIFFL